jgi:hypothetical protein
MTELCIWTGYAGDFKTSCGHIIGSEYSWIFDCTDFDPPYCPCCGKLKKEI